jgi:tetratricopeptide (TPR) repeat protein
MTFESTLHLRASVAVIRIAVEQWGDSGTFSPDDLIARLLDRRGFHYLEENLLLVGPTPGDEAVFDAAIGEIRAVETTVSGEESPAERIAVLVFPGVAEFGPGGPRLVEDDLLDDLRRRAPAHGPGIYITGRAASTLETPPVLEQVPAYEGPSGKVVPLFRAERSRLDRLPWRNPTVFDQAPPYVSRAKVEEVGRRLLDEPSFRVTGPLGCGKTRLVWEILLERSLPCVWVRIPRRTTCVPPLAEQIALQVLTPSETQRADPLHAHLGHSSRWEKVRTSLDRPRPYGDGWRSSFEDSVPEMLEHLSSELPEGATVVVDDCHLAREEDAALVSTLLAAGIDGSKLKLVLIGRAGKEWRSPLDEPPRLDLTPLAAGELESLAKKITEGLSIPAAVRNRFTESVNGNPFAFEECLFALIHEKSLRRVYGSFFFGGDLSTRFRPSQRYTRHLESEVARLGPTLPVRLLSLVDLAVPAPELASAASILGEPVEPGWEVPFLQSGLLASAPSPWGDGLRLVSQVDSRGLRNSFDSDTATAVRHQIGELLAARSESGKQSWSAYGLLAGSAEALEPLSRVFKTAYADQIPDQNLLDALVKELRSTRERRGGSRTELDLLWRLLPLARRLGCLARFEDDLARGIRLAETEPDRLLALASVKARIEQDAGEYQKAESTLKNALASAREVNVKRRALLMVQLGKLLMRQNRLSDAEELFSNLQAASEESSSSDLSATCLFHLGNIAFHKGRLEEALAHHRRALSIRKDRRLAQPVGSSLSALGTIAGAIGNYPQALEYYRQAKSVLEQEGQEAEVAFALLGMARMLSRLGDFTAATGPARKALALREGRDDSSGEAIARIAVARNYLDLGRPDEALAEARKAHFQLNLVSTEGPLAEAEELLGEIQLRKRKPEEARRHLQSALSRRRKLSDTSATALTLAKLIESSLTVEDSESISTYTSELEGALEGSSPADLREILYFRLFAGLDWLSSHGHDVGTPRKFLEKAYRAVIRNAGHLDHESRQQYLFNVPAIREIVETATRRGLDTPGAPDDVTGD